MKRAGPITPAPPEFRATHVLLFAAVAVPGLLLTATGIVSLALHRFTIDIVLGIMTLAFAMWVVVGGFAAWLLVRRSERKTRLQHDFVSSVSHELRTPLTGIRMLVETLKQRRADPDQAQKCIDLLDEQVGRLGGLVEEVLEFGRLQVGAGPLELGSIRVEAVADAALDAARATPGAAERTVEREIPSELRVKADRRALERVLSNLISNAFKYGGDGRRVWLRGERERDKVSIIVEDEGPGVPLRQRRKVFQPFFRGDDARVRELPGTGLGLAIVQRLVQAQGGKIRVEARPGGGARFVIVLEAA